MKPEYREIYLRLVQVLVNAARLNDSTWMDVLTDTEDETSKLRVQIKDTLISCQYLLRQECMTWLAKQLETVINSADAAQNWASIEIFLFALSAVVDGMSADTKEDPEAMQQLHNVLYLFPRLPYHDAIVAAAVLMLGNYAEWMVEQTAMLQTAVNYALMALNANVPVSQDHTTTSREQTLQMTRTHITGAAVQTLRALCHSVSEQESTTQNIAPLFDPIVSIYERVCNALPDEQSTMLADAVGCCVWSLAPEHCPAALQRAAAPAVRALQTIHDLGHNATDVTTLVTVLKILAALMKHASDENQMEPHPAVALLAQVWPLLQAMLSRHYMEQEYIEAHCFLLQKTIRAIKGQAAPAIPELVNGIVQYYPATREPALVRTAQAVLQTVGEEPSCRDSIRALIAFFMGDVVAVVQWAAGTAPDSVVAYLEFLKEVVSNNLPSDCVAFDKLPSMVQGCVQALHLGDRSVSSAACALLSSLLQDHADDAWETCIEGLMQQYGLHIVGAVIELVATTTMRPIIGSCAGVIQACALNRPYLLTAYSDSCNKVLNPALSASEVQAFVANVMKARIHHSRRFQVVVGDFAIRCHRHSGSSYKHLNLDSSFRDADSAGLVGSVGATSPLGTPTGSSLLDMT
eukprot:TRINITY_DN1461_c0_g1_i1.p1 TRINITY_DN1461_c0_g1~~TRINITY_DN1461_c0_g1_i1.p1  ORF type:complete len:633 (+),score=153.53 TRINITY_DN1461_c0_g1_i1:1146-3044(+)